MIVLYAATKAFINNNIAYCSFNTCNEWTIIIGSRAMHLNIEYTVQIFSASLDCSPP
jgi:hypothetical protein